MKINLLSDDDVKILKEVIDEKRRNVQGGRGFGEKVWNPEEDQNTPEVYIALPPTDGIPGLNQVGTSPGEDDEPGYAECEIYQLIDNGIDTPQLKKMDLADKTVYNISTSTIPGSTEWVLVVKTKTGKWVAVTGGGTDIVHGIVHKVLGCGYYEIELADWSGTTPDPDLRYTTGTSEGCDPCDSLNYGVGTALDDCTVEATIEDPVSQLTGLGVYVLAFDPQSISIPLKVPSDCLILNRGSKNSLGGTSSDTEDVYQIVRGYQTHYVVYDKEYECCTLTGEWKLISQIAYIIAAKKCDEQSCYVCPTE